MATVNSITKRAMRLLQVLEAGEAPTGEEAEDALNILNNIIDSWANEALMLFARTQHQISFVPGQTRYTIGASGDFNVTRPVTNGIMNAFTRDSDGTDWPISEIDNDQYQQIILKNTVTTYPLWFYYRATFPLGEIDVFPSPGANLTFFINVKSQFTAFAGVSTSVDLPPGYVRCLEYALAEELGPEYLKSTTVANFQQIKSKVIEAKEYIKNTNDVNIPELQSDAAYIGNDYYRNSYSWWVNA